MAKPTDDNEAQRNPCRVRWSVDLRLTVWSAQDGWHARLVGADMTERDFASPFELARYVSGPLADRLQDKDTDESTGTGLR